MTHRSIVKWFDAKKGYGFLVNPDGGADIFVHYTTIQTDQRFKTLRTGEEITFEITDGPKGIHAKNVVSLDPLPEEKPLFQPPSPERVAQRVGLGVVGLESQGPDAEVASLSD